MDTLPLVDPETGDVLCTCGTLYGPPTAYVAARQCQARHLPTRIPVIPGDALRRAAPFTPTTYPARTARPWWRRALFLVAFLIVMGAVGVLLGLVILAAVSSSAGPAAPYRPGFVTPATYGPPGPSGGPIR